MKLRVASLCLSFIAAASAYNLVIQEFQLTGGGLATFKCADIANVHVAGKTYPYDCYDTPADSDPNTVGTRHIVYRGDSINTKAKSLDILITLSDGSTTIGFPISPKMKAGQLQTDPGTTKFTPPSETPVDCSTTPADPSCVTTVALTTTTTTPSQNPNDSPSLIKAAKKTVLKPRVEGSAASVSVEATPIDCGLLMNKGKNECMGYCDDHPNSPACVPAIRLRGPGPVRPPVRTHPVEDTVVEDRDDEEAKRVKREDPPKLDDPIINFSAIYYILDEAGNPAAVWAAVIEGIILLLLIGACFYFFFWAPRARAVKAAAADPYKDDRSYSVSYANSSYNNQRIDAFQNPPAAPAAPPRPANSAYMDDYVTDNIGAMSRTAATTAPASAVTNSSAFQPTHQRYDSSGLVTVNLS